MSLIRHLVLVVWLISYTTVSNAADADGKFTENKTLHQGYFSFLHDESQGKIFLEIDKFEHEFLFQSSMPHGIGSNDIGLDRGQLGKTRMVQFERVGQKVFLRQLNTYYRANSNNELEKQAVKEAFASSIIWGFSVAHESDNKVYIDYTPFLLSDIHQISSSLNRRKQGSYKVDAKRSGLYIARTKAFPDNTELEATITFSGKGKGQYIRSVAPDANAVTVNLHHSLIKLPDDGYQVRKFHPYSGFWSYSYADYASAIDQPLVQRVIPRHRLHKKDPSAKISEAVEPIIYYLDAGVPEPVRSALLDGARWWDQAFEAIGYKNAFQVKILPSDADPMDVRYNVIQWVHRATRGWSYGSSVTDPRTGEIIKGHVTLGSLRVRQDYLIALGLTSPFDGKSNDTTEMKAMALARIRQLSAHEVGHTLGIAHNFAASVNDRASVMDYPHPLIMLKDGAIDLSQAYATDIGRWDKHVVAYGYADIDAKQEQRYLTKVINQAQASGLLYMSDPDARPKSGAHNTGHLWDNGENAASELSRMLEVRNVALKNFGLNSIPEGTPLSELENVLVPIYNFHRFQVEATAKLIGGVDYQYQLKQGSNEQKLHMVGHKTQQQAVNALLKTLSPSVLTLPAHITQLIPPKAYGYSRDRESFTSNTGLTFDPVSAAQANAKHTLSLLLNAPRLARIEQQHATDASISNTTALVEQLLKATIKSKPSKGMALLVQQRVNQQVVEQLLEVWHNKNAVIEVKSALYLSLTDLTAWLENNLSSRKYRALSGQYKVLVNLITHSLNEGKMMTPASTIKMPPGSPIGDFAY